MKYGVRKTFRHMCPLILKSQAYAYYRLQETDKLKQSVSNCFQFLHGVVGWA